VLLAAALPALAGEIPTEQRLSRYAQMGRELRAMQDDPAANSAMLWLAEGDALWKAKAGEAARSCADCHGESGAAMKGVAARHPAIDLESGHPRNLEQSINFCRTKRQRATPLDYESRELLALTAFVASQSRGMPIAVEESERSRPFIEAGREIFLRRLGQINIACAQCHDDNWGRRLAGSVIPQGQPTGYPLYRLEWQGLGSLQRRLRGCMAGVRAQPYDYESAELVNLELFLMWRARGMEMEAPAVRP
jgi:sulfur-oxidizing protein SoxA